MTKPFAIALLLTGLICNAHGTAQTPERLIYKGETNRLCTLPLDPYLKAHKLRLWEIEPPEKHLLSSGCWRGYIGTWEIKNGFLWLVKLEQLDRTDVPLVKVFPGQIPPIKAAWFSGTLHLTQGKRLLYVHAEFESVFERDVFIEIREGKIISEKVKENKSE